jgi:hypothetical protein
MEIKYYIASSNEMHFVRPAGKLTDIQSVSLNFHAAVKDSVLLRCDAAFECRHGLHLQGLINHNCPLKAKEVTLENEDQ